MRNRICNRTATGFTLVEVLVAMMVMAIMAVMAWQGVDGIVRTRAVSQARLEQTLRLNTVVAQWDQDLASIQDSRAVPQSLQCDGSSVRMVRRTPDGLQIVAWSYRPDDSGGAWVRWASPPATTTGQLTDSWLRSLQLQGDEPGSLKTLTGMTGWQVYFYQANGWANCQSTGDLVASNVVNGIGSNGGNPNPGTGVGSTGATGGAGGNALATPNGTGSAPPLGQAAPARVALPGGVRVVLSFAPGGGLNGDLTRDTLLGP